MQTLAEQSAPALKLIRQAAADEAQAWLDALDAAVLEHWRSGPNRVFEAALDHVARHRIRTVHAYVYDVCKRLKATDTCFGDLPAEQREVIASFAMVRFGPDFVLEHLDRAREAAAKAFTSETFELALKADGPSRAADQAVGQLLGLSATEIRKQRLAAK